MLRIGNSFTQTKSKTQKAILYSLVFGGIGLAMLATIRAAMPNDNIEAELSILSSGAAIGNDPNASSGNFVRFGAEQNLTGYQLVWREEFDGDSLDQSRWSSKKGGGVAGANVEFTDDAVAVKDGNATISTYTENGVHKTGWIQTEDKFQSRYGYYEARVLLSPGENIGSGFWLFHEMINTPGDPWNHGVEVDIFENSKFDWLGEDISDKVISSINWGEYEAYWPLHPSLGGGFNSIGNPDDYHVYAVEWTPNQLKFFLDDNLVWTVNNTTLSPVPQRDMYIVLSHNPKGGVADYGSKDNSHPQMTIDWVRVHQLPSETPDIPSNLEIQGGSSDVQLSWEVTANATSYSVQRSTAGSNTYEDIGTTDGTSFVDTDCNSNAACEYRVQAQNALNQSEFSSSVTSFPNIAASKSASASSTRGSDRLPELAVDGNGSTLWESVWGTDNVTLTIDLESSQTISGVRLVWSDAFASSYALEVSDDGSSWSGVYNTVSGDGGIDEIGFSSTSARFIRLSANKRAHTWSNPSPFGYGLYEFEAYSIFSAKPTGVRTKPFDANIKLSWQQTPGASNYVIKRSNQPGGPYNTVAENINSTQYLDANLSNDQAYFYVVLAQSGDGLSSPSNESLSVPRANIALWKNAYADFANGDQRPYKAVDGAHEPTESYSSRWISRQPGQSGFEDIQEFYVDLGAPYIVNKIVLDWSLQYAVEYKLLVSTDDKIWSTVYHQTNGQGDQEEVSIAPVEARYVKMQGLQRNNQEFGYSLDEFEVYAQLD